ncbi:hypothetical protein GCM10023168_15410 [Fodinibacter luteus]|uniref:PNPLA domain-containing protein n=1 Tax=Fodinibacter luteus TaxID=552064 RepID=A0ABP8KBI1_9MICO
MEDQPDPHGLGAHDLSTVPPEEIRFGVVMNGGVSLAVWMGGVALELDRLVKAGDGQGPYADLLRLTGCRARVDVVSGTSAGGVNGAALALAQVNRYADLASLRDVWVEQGRIEALLRQPFRGAPSSLLKGDDHFLPQLHAAMARLADPLDLVPADQAPMDLTMATTVLGGNQEVTVDSLGQRLPQTVHAARFRWRRPTDARDVTGEPGEPGEPGEAEAGAGPRHPERVDPFCAGRIAVTAAQMALAARASSSFPVAFEPTFVPVPTGGAADTDTTGLRPSMADVVEEWGDAFPARDRSRFVVDGGVLANTPTRAAVEAIGLMPAEGPVRRVMLLVYPHAPAPGADPGDDATRPPTLAGSLTGVLGALSAQGSRTFVDELEDHNIRAASRRGTRSDILGGFGDRGPGGRTQDLEGLGAELFPHYRRLRIWHAARDLARRQVGHRPPASWPEGDDVWDYERIRRAAELAQQAVEDARGGGGSPTSPVHGIPYLPETYPTRDAPDTGSPWRWGVSGAVSVAETVNELLRELVWMLPPGDDWTTSSDARKHVTELIRDIRECRHLTDDAWEEDEVLAALRPDQHYWMLRLASYARLMGGGGDEGVRQAISRVAQSEYERRFEVGNDLGAAEAWRASVTAHLEEVLLDPHRAPGTAGEAVAQRVRAVVDQLLTVVPVLRRAAGSRVITSASRAGDVLGDRRSLERWCAALAPGTGAVTVSGLLTTLLQLEVASTTIGDDTMTGSTIPIEVVQLSAQTRNAFARHSTTGDDKLGGWSVKRFGGFLKRSWRVNDWTWGRLDAATVLCRTVLDPARVRRVAYLSGYLTSHPDPWRLAESTVDGLVASLFAGTGLRDDPRVRDLRDRAVVELAGAFAVETTPTGQLPPSMPALADLFAWSVQLATMPEEVAALAAAIREDRADGANPRSRGELFLAAEAPLVGRLESALGEGSQVSGADRVALLAAFDRAGVGREPLTDETSSDLMIRNASTAGAVSATVLDSPSSGLGAVRPVTRLVRGAMLVLHWTIVGLTSRGVVPRMLALLGLSLGGILLTASLLGALPGAWSGPAALFGASCLLAAFAFGALRTGTMLHGLVLLSPIVPLLTFALSQLRAVGEDEAAAEGAARGGVTLAAMIGIALGLLVLGSLPAAYGSVWLALGSLADRRGVPHLDTSGRSRVARWWVGAVRRARGVGRSLPALVVPAVVVAVPVVVAWWIVDTGIEQVAGWLTENRWWFVGLAVACLVLGSVAAFFFGDQLRPATRVRRPGADALRWDYGPLVSSAGVNASWAVLYGAGYFVIAIAVVWSALAGEGETRSWLVALVVTALVLGVALGLLYPLVAPLLALRGLERRELARDLERTGVRYAVADPVVLDDDSQREAYALATARRSYAVDLAERGVAYRWLVSTAPGIDGRRPSLAPRGAEMLRRLDEARAVPPPSGLRWRVRRAAWRVSRSRRGDG